jgi:hypothetical protein
MPVAYRQFAVPLAIFGHVEDFVRMWLVFVSPSSVLAFATHVPQPLAVLGWGFDGTKPVASTLATPRPVEGKAAIDALSANQKATNWGKAFFAK